MVAAMVHMHRRGWASMGKKGVLGQSAHVGSHIHSPFVPADVAVVASKVPVDCRNVAGVQKAV